MLDHLGLDVSDYERSKDFYEKALAPLGLRVLMEPIPGVGGFGGDDGKPFFWIGNRGRGAQTAVHVAFAAPDRATVDAFHAAALDAGRPTTAAPACVRSTTRTITAPSCSTPTATTSRPSATGRRNAYFGASSISFSSRLSTLPVALRGSSSRNQISRGTLKPARFILT